MGDVHVHFLHNHSDRYTQDYFKGFITAAECAGLDEIYLLEHTHQFLEFEEVYAPIKAYSEYQRDWLQRRMTSTIDSYLNFIETVKGRKYLIKVKFGLEVCYIPETSDILARILTGYNNFDFLTGSIHWIDGWGFDHPNKKELWCGLDINKIYHRYYDIMFELCKSDLFTGLAHPDSIKCFGYTPTYDMTDTYIELAILLNKHGLYVENSGGLRLNYSPSLELGMNKQMLEILKQYGVTIYTASDAHKQNDVGTNIRELEKMLKYYNIFII